VFCLANAAVMLTAGLFFLAFPAELAYPPAAHSGVWEDVVQITRRVALQYNLAPSLHVALAVTCVTAYAERARWGGKLLLWAWALGIVASTLLLHEHHLLDVVTGWPLGLAGKYLVYDRLLRRQELQPAAAGVRSWN
jgi:membrane-associated phospholipid phosphatase